MSITLIQAEKVLQAAKAKAEIIGVAMNIAIVDEGANIKLFLRMDNAFLGSAEIAIKKARTSSLFSQNSGDIGKLSQPGGPLYNIEQTNGGLISFPGGVIIKDNKGITIGAIGVSGGAVEQDFEVATVGAVALL